ncbi:MAG: hypothetical protein Ct9H300mP1_31930 [Planctomycetaceae bacterium]|nr:MAG: hypothetical protein Ct9H300mP1_31930 [Planctomycetaceae bacterium]
MNPLSLVRHLALLGLAYAALVAETSVVPQLNPGGATLRPLWIVRAPWWWSEDGVRRSWHGQHCWGSPATAREATVRSDWTSYWRPSRSACFHPNGPAVGNHSITITTLIAVLLITGIESTSDW